MEQTLGARLSFGLRSGGNAEGAAPAVPGLRGPWACAPWE